VTQLLQRLPARSVLHQLGQQYHSKNYLTCVPASPYVVSHDPPLPPPLPPTPPLFLLFISPHPFYFHVVPLYRVGMHVEELLNARARINKAVLSEMTLCKDHWGIEVVPYEGLNPAPTSQSALSLPRHTFSQFTSSLPTTIWQMRCMLNLVLSGKSVLESLKAKAAAPAFRTSAKARLQD
jgi:hypothetical protein